MRYELTGPETDSHRNIAGETHTMPARVTLKVTAGKLAGKEFVFEERTTCIIGRASAGPAPRNAEADQAGF